MNANATAAKTTTAVACACGGYTAKDATGREIRTGCTATTKRTFAPGHDARLKGFLIRAGAEGMLISTPEGGADQVAVRVAERFGFGHMVADGIEAAKSRAFAKAMRDAAKAEAPAPVTVTAKVGRWVREGVVTDGVFSYTDKQGVTQTATKFTRV